MSNLGLQLNKEMFTRLSEDEKNKDGIVRPSVNFWKDALSRLVNNKMAFTAFWVIVAIIVLAITVPMISQYSYKAADLPNANQRPSSEHWFGTDSLGRDLFVRTFYGARYSLIIGFAAAAINLVIGVIYGSVAGFFGGKVDMIMMRFVDILYSIPLTIFVIILMTVMQGYDEVLTIVLALSISYWIGMARIVRGETLQLKEQEFILAARSLGASNKLIIFKHLIPNCFGQILVTMTLLIPSAIFTEAFLSFIGIGISAPKASLGTLANDAMASMYTTPYQLFFPSLMICLIILSFNLFSDGLQEALDPKMKK